MAAFKFKFESIYAIKERLEKKVQKELAVIDLDLSNKKKEIIKLMEILKEQKQNKINQKSKKVSEYHFDEKYESYLIEQINLMQKYMAQKKIERNKKLKELVQKSKETKTFEKLREKHLENFIKDQDKKEQKVMDEVAVNGFLKEA